MAEPVAPKLDKFYNIDSDTLYLAGPKGTHKTLALAKSVKVSIDGKDAEPSDLKPGMMVTVTGDPVTGISFTKEDKK